MPDELVERLRRFHNNAFPKYAATFRNLVDTGQHPTSLFIGCSDSRLMPYLLTDSKPGELFTVRNVGAFVPPYDGYMHGPSSPGVSREGREPHWVGYHGTAAAIEFAILNLKVGRIIVCGHSHCGGIRALYDEIPAAAQNLSQWLELGRDAVLPVAEPGPEVLRRTEERAVILQLERLMDYPMVRESVAQKKLTLHGWHYVIEEGEVYVFDVLQGAFVAASAAENAGTGPYQDYVDPDEPDGAVS